LRADASEAQRRLLAAFQAASRRRDRRVVVVGHGLVLATQPALDLLEPADHAAIRACVDAGDEVARLTLASGRVARLGCVAVEGTDGTLVDIVVEKDDRGAGPAVPVRWPLLVVGEPGTGRTTEARKAAGAGAVTLDAVEIVRVGEQAWAALVSRLLDGGGPPAIVENIQLLSEPLTALLAARMRTSRRNLALTSAPGQHLVEVHASIAARCGERRDLVPLRSRRHEIPRLAQRMLTGEGKARFTPEALRALAAQPWAGNLVELAGVIRSVAELRSAGDVVPADLPPSHRGGSLPTSPFDQAEREVIVSAIAVAGGNKLEAARALGVSRSTLYNRLKALRIR
jgi:uncharacterized membrane protein